MSEPPLGAPQLSPSTPIAWEDPSLSFARRILATLTDAFSPVQSVTRLRVGPLAPAIGFFLLTAVPCMLAWGVMPFTHTLSFTPGLGLAVTSAKLPIWLDVVRASGIGFGLSVLALVCWGAPFASLLRAFAAPTFLGIEARHAALRLLFYRAWLVPFGTTAFLFAAWVLPADSLQLVMLVFMLLFLLLPRLLVLVSCQSMAGAFGAGAIAAIAVGFVPLLVEWAVGRTVWHFVEKLLPAAPGT